MYDLHCHILFGVDDGADSAEESIRMARIACESGTKGIAATPHCNISEFNRNEWTAEFTRKIIMLNSTLAELDIPVKFVGVGEGIDDLQPFVAKEFADGIFEVQE